MSKTQRTGRVPSARARGGSQRDALGVTLAERTAEAIRERILGALDGFTPGSRLYPNRLAADLGVSVTPTREALRILAAEGLIEFSPRQGTRVMSLSLAEIDELLRIRGGLETIALRFRTSQLTPGDLKPLQQELKASERALDRGDLDTYLVHDLEFHRLLVATGGSARLLTMWEQTCQQAQVLEVYFAHDHASAKEALTEHKDLLGLLATTAPAAAEPALWQHWEICSRQRVHRAYQHLAEPAGAESPAGPTGS